MVLESLLLIAFFVEYCSDIRGGLPNQEFFPVFDIYASLRIIYDPAT